VPLRALFNQFITYAGVGAVGTAGHYLLLLLLVEGLGAAPYKGAVAGFLLGAVINYYLNHRITFRSAKRHHDALPKFLAVAALGVALTGGLMAWATERLHIHYFIAQLFTTGLLLCLTFVGNRLWTFNERAASGGQG
jgi:putative flippase GtrA